MNCSSPGKVRPQPVRTCVGCRRRAPQCELVRIVRMVDGTLAVGRTLPGRGAWLCRDQPECLTAAIRRRAFGRALRAPVASTEGERLAEVLGRPDADHRDDSIHPAI